MRQSLIAALIVCVMAIGQTASAGTSDIYLSFSAFGDGGAAGNTVNSDLMIGDTGSVYIYVNDTYSIDTGAFLDVFNDNVNTAIFTGAEVFNFDIVVGTTPFDTRWTPDADGTDGDGPIGGGDVSAGFIDEMRGFRVTEGTGILPSQVTGSTFEDQGHDASSSAFLFARVDFEIVGAGTSVISLGIGDGLVVDGGIELTPDFGSATIEVAGPVIPEPTTAGLLALGLCGLVTRRRR